MSNGSDKLRSFFNVLTSDLQKLQTADSHAVNRQLARCRKKARFDDVDLTDVTLRSFREANSTASEVSIRLSAEEKANARDFITRALWTFFYSQTDVQQVDFDLVTILRLWSFGPGASLGCKETHFIDKIMNENYTVTESALPFAKLLLRSNPHLARHYMSGNVKFELVEGSKMTVVPKNETIGRTVCTEPLLNMALQLAAGACIEGALRTVGLDVSGQSDLNKEMARQGSLTGELATIDLKWASDLITPSLIKELWPVSWYTFLFAISSRKTEIDGEQVDLHMMSTMGNGFTFPLMTMTLLALCYATQQSRYLDMQRWAVFGDDIICPTPLAPDLVSCLERAGLIVNVDKSYWDGPFRESCGGDFYSGVDITPFYVKALTQDAEVHVAINIMMRWALKTHTLLHLCESFRLLLSFLTPHARGPAFVPQWEDPSSGIQRPTVHRTYYKLSVKPRRNTKLLTTEYFQLLVALGGYGVQVHNCKKVPAKANNIDGEPRFSFTRRSTRTRYKWERVRLPKGYCNGGDWMYFSAVDMDLIDCFYSYLLGD